MAVPSRQFLMCLIVVVPLLWTTASSLYYFPHSLSYFNEIAGGPENGEAHLVDSNLDWGQDLFFLKKWYNEHPDARPFYLAYFGQVDPRLMDIDFAFPQLKEGILPAGYYAVSQTFLQGARYAAFDGKGRFVPVDEETPGVAALRDGTAPIYRCGYSIVIFKR